MVFQVSSVRVAVLAASVRPPLSSNTLLKKPDSEPTALPLTASQLITGAWVPVAVTV